MTATRIVLALTAILLIAYDIFILIHSGADATISWQIYTLSKSYPALPFGGGFLCGHLFWVQKGA